MINTLYISQPYFLGYAGYFHKILVSDLFVILDDVQFVKGSFYNRNKIKNREGVQWLTIPVKSKNHLNKTIGTTFISDRVQWKHKFKKSLELNYKKAKYFNEYKKDIFSLIDNDEFLLSNYVSKFLTYILRLLNREIEIVYSSSYDFKGKKSDRVLDICKYFKPKIYFSGVLTKDYLEVEHFEKEGVKVIFQDYKINEYGQQFGSFIPYLSILDILFNCGHVKMEEIIMKGNISKEDLLNEI